MNSNNFDAYSRVTLPQSQWQSIHRWFGHNVSLASLILTEHNKIEKTRQYGPRKSLRLGIPAIDAMINGVSPGDSLYIGTEESSRAAIGLNIVQNLAIRGGKKLLLFQCAKGEYAFARELLSLCAKVEERKLKESGALTEHELAQIKAAVEAIQSADVSVVSTPNIPVEALCKEVSGLNEAERPDLILIDNFHFLTTQTCCKSKQQEYCMIAQRLWTLAKDTRIPIVLIGPLSRHRRRMQDYWPSACDMPAEDMLSSFDKIIMLHRNTKKADALYATTIKNPDGAYGYRRLSLDTACAVSESKRHS